jgi:zinc resistance-associated protein
MKSPLLFAAALATSISVTAFLTPSFAQGPQQQMQGQADEEKEASPSDKQAFLNARIAALKAVLALTPEQEKLWPPVETAIRDTVKESAERAQKLRSGPEPTSAIDVLNIIADHEMSRAQALKKFVNALQPLVASLTPEQKRRIPAFIGLGESDDRGPNSAELWIFEEEQD